MRSSGITVIETMLRGVLILEPHVFQDERGFFLESYNERTLAEVGIMDRFVQDNHSYSIRNVLRGLHYQLEVPQAKLVRAIGGAVLDIAVDLRKTSPTLGQWFGTRLSGENKRMLWIPVGFAHGFQVLSESVHVLYKSTSFFNREAEHTIAWNDPVLKIDWQLNAPPIVSPKDSEGLAFHDAPKFD
jgi:dTDP-4-dehydrorhamnose 3,5-epimerase